MGSFGQKLANGSVVVAPTVLQTSKIAIFVPKMGDLDPPPYWEGRSPTESEAAGEDFSRGRAEEEEGLTFNGDPSPGRQETGPEGQGAALGRKRKRWGGRWRRRRGGRGRRRRRKGWRGEGGRGGVGGGRDGEEEEEEKGGLRRKVEKEEEEEGKEVWRKRKKVEVGGRGRWKVEMGGGGRNGEEEGGRGGRQEMGRKRRERKSSISQLVLTFTLSCLQLVAAFIGFILFSPHSLIDYKKGQTPGPKDTQGLLRCEGGTLACLAYALLLMLTCTIYTIKAWGVLEAFNEVKPISFTMYTTCIAWLVFSPIFFSTTQLAKRVRTSRGPTQEMEECGRLAS
ncbi:metabotropic glutamate receptor 6 [Limosa lapponica baueri]|uniref:Metabotropic glutamate receptor 6 n=1 Tax=Limosa lapponica baueri TaxID=1758121 RepID=A0A2I0T9R0_LIMLA|nr:metabotropic glutamate receptor 6 [Limosa lapponica baueri]